MDKDHNHQHKADQESKHWGEVLTQENSYYSWFHSPLISNVMNKRITGDSNLDWFSWINNKYLIDKPFSNGLVLGCGFANWETKLINDGICKTVDALDISEHCVSKAIERANQQNINGVNYIVADVNKIQLPNDKYDIILCVMSLHHFTDLESIFFQLEKSLTAKGWFIANEFVGPRFFQWGSEQLRLVNQILSIMPEKYGTRTLDNVIQGRIDKPPLEEFIKHSPYEAIRSNDIINVAQTFLDIVDIRPYGGTILHLVLNYLIGNFNEDKPEDRFLLQLLSMFEDEEINKNNIESDFSVFLGKKRTSGHLPFPYKELQDTRLENLRLIDENEKFNRVYKELEDTWLKNVRLIDELNKELQNARLENLCLINENENEKFNTVREELIQARIAMDQIMKTSSWQLTAPLRYVKRMIIRIRSSLFK